MEKQREGSTIQGEVLLLELTTNISKCTVTLFCDGLSYLPMFRTRKKFTPRIQHCGKHSHLPADTAPYPRSLESPYICLSASPYTFMARRFNLPQTTFLSPFIRKLTLVLYPHRYLRIWLRSGSRRSVPSREPWS